ncbi:MAG: TspO protein [Candidatus Muiribacterium halophilum]|uniref:TspO protein n=1 Tax=Muiribacterium halophilum TaxID=2053465 RepID=A0A2N5ZEA4_MUIH1|nr:MAG: TspO protein [Candidatus Muirbacterium halophilum]
MNKKNTLRLILSIIICNLAGIFGAVFTKKSVSTWYTTLEKPSFNPPGWVFGPVWTVIYIMMGISLFYIWDSKDNKLKKKTLILFYIQLLLNGLWSFLFFGLRSPFYAFIDIILLLIFIFLTIAYSFKISRKISYLLLPYLLWVCFATLLNYKILVLNT